MSIKNEKYISNYSAETIEKLLQVQSGESDIGEQLQSLQTTITEVSDLKTKIDSQISSLEESLKTLIQLQSKIDDTYTAASLAKETADEAKETADDAKETASNNSNTIEDLRGSFTT
jgi:methyl-accepting chemotaxis protein